MTDKEKIRNIIELFIAWNGETDVIDVANIDSAVEFIANSMQEEPVSEKKCMFTKDNYTDEDRNVLCEDCKEKCEYSKKEEPVSEDLEEAANEYVDAFYAKLGTTQQEFPTDAIISKTDFKAGAKWHKDKIMQNTIDAHCFGFQGAALFSFRLPADNYLVGSEIKIIVIKED